jgi:hypothetical protein
MKIQGSGEMLRGLSSARTSPPAVPAQAGFGEVLKQTIEQTPAAGMASAPPTSVQFRPLETVQGSSEAVRLERYLDFLDSYRQELSDPAVSLKRLESSVRQLEEGRQALSPLIGALPEGDGLKDIMNRTLVTASLEIIRFRRGDYL